MPWVKSDAEREKYQGEISGKFNSERAAHRDALTTELASWNNKLCVIVTTFHLGGKTNQTGVHSPPRILKDMRKPTDLVSKLALSSKPAIAPPKVWNATYKMHLGSVDKRPKNVEMVMVGLRWAPETGPVAKMNSGKIKMAERPPSKLGTSAPDVKVLCSFITDKSRPQSRQGTIYFTISLKPTAMKQVKYTSKQVPISEN